MTSVEKVSNSVDFFLTLGGCPNKCNIYYTLNKYKRMRVTTVKMYVQRGGGFRCIILISKKKHLAL